MSKLQNRLLSLLMSVLLVFSMFVPVVQAVDLGITDETIQQLSASSESESTGNPDDSEALADQLDADASADLQPTIPIKIRIEGYDKTIVPLTEIDLSPYDITHAVGNNSIGKWYLDNDQPLAIHAIVKALELQGLDVSDANKFDFGAGNFITNINGLEMNSVNEYMDGWMYFVNNEFAPVGVGNFPLTAHDEITMYFTTNYGTVSYSWFDRSIVNTEINEEESLQLQEKGAFVEGATILVNGQPLEIDGEEVRTDENGIANLQFAEPGEYDISAKRMDGEFSNITRPYSKIIVESGKDVPSAPEPEEPAPTPDESLEPNPEPAKEKVEELLKNVSDFYSSGNRSDKTFFPWGVPELSWTEIVALKATGWNTIDSLKMPEWIEKDPGLKENTYDTEHIRYIFALLAVGKDPSHAWETNRNLYAELAAQQKEDGSIGGVNKHMWAMLALDTGEKLGQSVGKWDASKKKKALDYLLTQEKQGGGFAFSGQTADSDMTGMALLALANYQSDSAANEAINRARHVLRQKQLDTAGWDSFGSKNSNSIATVISGLIAIGEDPLSVNWQKGGLTPLDALQEYQLDHGAFTFTLGKYASTNMMATEQSLIALQEVKMGKSVWQQLAQPADSAPEPEEPSNPESQTKYIQVTEGQEFILQGDQQTAITKPIVLEFSGGQTLPKITAERAGVKLEIPAETKVNSAVWDKKLQIPTVQETFEEDKEKISAVLDGQNLKGVFGHIKVGGDQTINFDRHVTLEFKDQGDLKAGFIDASGNFFLISKVNVRDSNEDVYAYKDGNNLIIKTNHFTEFLVFETAERETAPSVPEQTPIPPPTVPSTKNVTFSVEKRTMGQGDIITSMQVALQDNDTAFTLLQRIASGKGISVNASGVGPTVYVKAIDGLSEFDGGPKSGWMYSVNGVFPQYSAGIYQLKEGDHLRWQYTKNLGEDLGEVWNPEGKEPDKKPEKEPGKDDAELPDKIENVPPQTSQQKKNIEITIQNVQQKLLHDGVQNEWEAIGLFQSGEKIPSSYLMEFNKNLNEQVISKFGNGRMKITDVERLVMAAGVIGIDPANADGKGFNLLSKIYDSELRSTGEDSLTFQGNNGVIFALIALDSKKYQVPEKAKWTREKLLTELLNTQKSDGSWSLEAATVGVTSIDITAMALTALAPYKEQPEVKKAINKTVAFLSKAQGSTGGFHETFVGGVSSEATAQVIIGLTANGFNPRSTSFTKNNINLIDHLLSFKAEDGGFKHLADDRESNDIATEQALQALVAYDLFNKGKGSLYSFADSSAITTPKPDPTPTPVQIKFSDVKGHWAADYIKQAVGLEIVQGYSDGKFKPNQSLTRAQAVSIIVRALDLKTTNKAPFTDTKNYAKGTQDEISAAYYHGLVKGKDGKFLPSQKVTRAQMALMLFRAYEVQNSEKYTSQDKAPFTDMRDYDLEANRSVNMLYNLKMAEGVNGKFKPGDSTTRAHATKMLIEFLNTK